VIHVLDGQVQLVLVMLRVAGGLSEISCAGPG
jgi:hypothetical protein